MILIIGAHKAFALYKAIEEGVNHMWTVSAFQQHPKTLMLCDEDATLELRVKTVKYFKVNFSINFHAIPLLCYYFIRHKYLISHLIRLHSKCFITILQNLTHALENCTSTNLGQYLYLLFIFMHEYVCSCLCGFECMFFFVFFF